MFPVEKPLLVTCGLPYVSGESHLGHLRTYVPADIYVRMLRKMGYDVLFICGSDTHGTPIVLTAEARGVPPEEIVKEYHEHFLKIFDAIGVEFDYYGSTDSESNHRRTKEIVEKLIENGYVYEKKLKLAFCKKCLRFLPDRYVKGVCPFCGATARGDECDQGCGKHLEPGEIREAMCKICGSAASYEEQEHFFFKLSSFRDFLLDFISKMNGTANAKNYAIEWVSEELKDWCITRNLEWGVKFPGRDNLVVYVWVDAPIGYISFTEDAAAERGYDWETYWKKEGEVTIVHFIGSDIIYHHCIFWPALLKGAHYSLPNAVVASGMVKIEGRTFSKSRGEVIWTSDFLKKFHPDTLRYYLASYTSHTKEVNFSWNLFEEKINRELVAISGNFIHRVISFAYNNFEAVPEGDIEDEVLEEIKNTKELIISAMEEYEFKKLVDAVMSLADFGNAFFQRHEPWHLIEKDKTRSAKVVKNMLQVIKAICIFLEPVIPRKMEEAWKQLGMEGNIHSAKIWEVMEEIKTGQQIKKPIRLFEKANMKAK